MARERDNTLVSGDSGGGLFTVVSVAVLVGTELLGATLAAGWAVAGLFELGDVFAYILMGLFGAGGIALLVSFVRSALLVEGRGTG